jgi:hypothetical protein
MLVAENGESLIDQVGAILFDQRPTLIGNVGITFHA